jgi:FAD/FMN-containing dehydrogenase
MSDALVASLRGRLAGPVVAPGDADWDRARTGYNVARDQRPAVVVYPESVEDAVAIVQVAAAHGAPVAPQGTGHGSGPLGSLDGAVLVRTERLTGVDIEPQTRRARVGAGARWGDVSPLADPHGLAALAGTAATVRVVGYCLGGGIGWLARKYGIACNSVRSVDIVTADGVARTVDHERDPELFWAIRGGGGNFGLVTGLELELFPAAQVHAGTFFWPFERAGEILHAWSEWTTSLPDEVTSHGRLIQFPPIPDVPEHLRGRAFVVVHAVFLAGEAEAAAALAPLRALGPEIDTFATIPPSALGMLNMDPPEPVPYTGNGGALAAFSGDAVDALATAAGPGSGSPLVSLEVRHLGAAVATVPPGAGALGAIDAPFMWFGVGIAPSPDALEAVDRFLDGLAATLAPWDAGRGYWNFAERKVDPATLVGADAHRRLQEVRRRVDPDGRFLSNHVIAVEGT